eukprot:TRINITY_DN41184_c0_g1_i2.p1 TRINITY_DN41184_c0_g1~~TRINITY_DN41184_c0_g1_i2.p1  ORF type:complete len:371 (+),score=48.66 TRINITY_DN41184_c0_g1_i2:39-1151(+)
MDSVIDRHAKYLKRTLCVLPGSLAAFDVQRMTIVYFAVSGLDVLNRLDMIEDMKDDIINWVYSCLINNDDGNKHRCGFRGSNMLRIGPGDTATHIYDGSHLAMTYTALCILVILGDDLSRINRENISKSIRSLQLSTGCFQATHESEENDMRFIYCAAAISKIINIKSGIDKEKAIDYIQKSISYEGGIAQGPWLEAHGGSTYCAIASLSLMESMDALSAQQRQQVVHWLINRQRHGFNGRPDKDDDTCYTFWIGGALHLLDASEYVNWSAILEFVLTTQNPVTAGFGKWPDSSSDSMHTYLGWAGLAIGASVAATLQKENNHIQPANPDIISLKGYHLQPLDPALNITLRAKKHLENLHKQFESSDRLL